MSIWKGAIDEFADALALVERRQPPSLGNQAPPVSACDAILSRDSLRLSSFLATRMVPVSQRGNEFGK